MPKKTKKKAKKVAVKKEGKTVTFQAKPKTDPYTIRPEQEILPTERTSDVLRTTLKTLINRIDQRDIATPDPLFPYLPEPEPVVKNDIPPDIRELATKMGEQMGAQGVVIVGFPINSPNPRSEPPTKEEMITMLKAGGFPQGEMTEILKEAGFQN